MRRRVLIEASGSLVSGFMIKAIRDAGHAPVASDIGEYSVGRYLADDFVLMPRKNDPALWEKIADILRAHRIDMVIPSLDETLAGWAERKQEFAAMGVVVAVSDADVVKTFTDKWLTHLFFAEHGIPAPASSLGQDYPMVKPRNGRGGRDVRITRESVDMRGMMSQEIARGEEYTVDVLCGRDASPAYIVPRKRIAVRDGKSTQGLVECNPAVIGAVATLCEAARFVGPVNVQCFYEEAEGVKVIEVNPRIAGGMALGFAATENWVALLCDNLIDGRPIRPVPVKNGLRMMRYYAEVFVS